MNRNKNNPRFDVTSLGETMLRLSVPEGKRLQTASQLDLYPGGAESNVLSLLSRLGHPCGWVSSLPTHALGWLVRDEIRKAGVCTEAVLWSAEGRIGTYYVEFAQPPRQIRVIYDRAESAMSRMITEDIDWSYLLDTRILHLTGITPALSDSCRQIVKTAVRQAKENRVALSFDVNYRQKLWSRAEAEVCLRPLVETADILFCSMRDAQAVFRCDGQNAEEVVRELQQLTSAKQIVMSAGSSGVWGWDDGHWYQQAARSVEIVDRVGAGDALAAGVLHGWLTGGFEQALRFGSITAALALSQYGDMVVTDEEEVIDLLAKNEQKNAIKDK